MNLIEARDALDTVAAIDEQIDKLEGQVTHLKRDREGIVASVRAAMEESNTSVLTGFRAVAKLSTKEFFGIEPGGWPKLYERIQRTGEFDLLGQVLKQTSCRERFNAGDEVPGVRRTEAVTIAVKPNKVTI